MPATVSTNPKERVVDVTEAEIMELLQRHVKLCIDNASLITIWPLVDDMADVLLRIINKDAHEIY